MKLRGVWIAVIALGLAGVAVYRSREVAPSPAAAPVAAPSPAPAQPAPAAAPKPMSAPQTSAMNKLTADEDAVLTMYDAIASAFEKDSKDCDAMGTSLDAIVERSASDVQRWAAEQSRMNEADRALAARRLEDVAGARVKRAQDALRLAMGTCPDSARFQAALQKLVTLNPAQ